MTPAEADSRIILSRQTLHRYADMTRAGLWPLGDLPLMLQEVAKLEEIAELHQGKALKLESLVEGWKAMIEAVRGRMH
jgi:hypothetical protein